MVGPGGGPSQEVDGTVLFDGRGGVVGVDVEPDAPERTVVLVGCHEDVKTTRSATVSVSRDARGEIASVVVRAVKAP